VGYRVDAAGQVYHLVNDHLGSIRVMTNTTGITKFESDYYPHGAPRVITSTKDSLLKFQGKQQDTESGLDNVRRMYSPTLARFLPTRTASMPPRPKTKGVPPPQSLNPGTFGCEQPCGSSKQLYWIDHWWDSRTSFWQRDGRFGG
jgi:hypothetical protein